MVDDQSSAISWHCQPVSFHRHRSSHTLKRFVSRRFDGTRRLARARHESCSTPRRVSTEVPTTVCDEREIMKNRRQKTAHAPKRDRQSAPRGQRAPRGPGSPREPGRRRHFARGSRRARLAAGEVPPPSLTEISEACARIQQGWTRRQHRLRAGLSPDESMALEPVTIILPSGERVY